LDEEIEIRRLMAIQLAAIKGDGAQDVIATLEECLALAQGDTIDHFDTFRTLQACRLVRGEISSALEIGGRLMRRKQQKATDERR
jgi:hypothetical protein